VMASCMSPLNLSGTMKAALLLTSLRTPNTHAGACKGSDRESHLGNHACIISWVTLNAGISAALEFLLRCASSPGSPGKCDQVRPTETMKAKNPEDAA
jgi:hypothetical protein